MNFPVLSAMVFVAVIAYIFGRVQGELRGIDAVVNNIRGTGRHFTAGEVVVGNVISWPTYEKNQFDHKGTVDGVPMESRSANSKHEATVLVKGTMGYQHPFLSGATDE